MHAPTDILIRTANPDILQQTLQQLPGVRASLLGSPGRYEREDGCWRARVFAGLPFLEFAFEQQGYGEIVREAAIP